MQKDIHDKTWHRIQLARSALFLSIAAVVSFVFAPFLMPCALAPVAILLAILSKGSEEKMSSQASRACRIAGITLAVNLIVLVLSVWQMTEVLADPGRRQQFDDLLYRSYGYRLEEILPLLPSFLSR